MMYYDSHSTAPSHEMSSDEGSKKHKVRKEAIGHDRKQADELIFFVKMYVVGIKTELLEYSAHAQQDLLELIQVVCYDRKQFPLHSLQYMDC